MTAQVSTPVRRRWPGERPPVVEHPAPEVPCRPATAEEIPRGARPIAKLAERHGWTVTATYSRGTRPGRPPRVVNSIALRFRRSEARAWAVWLDGKFDDAQTLLGGGTPIPRNLTTLRGDLAAVPDCDMCAQEPAAPGDTMCTRCRQAHDMYDGMTPEERAADDAAIVAYAEECRRSEPRS